jgi:hypothetical protein
MAHPPNDLFAPRRLSSTTSQAPTPSLRFSVFFSCGPSSCGLHPLRSGLIRLVNRPLRPSPGFPPGSTTHADAQHKSSQLAARCTNGPPFSPSPSKHPDTLPPRIMSPAEILLEFAHLPRRVYLPD